MFSVIFRKKKMNYRTKTFFHGRKHNIKACFPFFQSHIKTKHYTQNNGRKFFGYRFFGKKFNEIFLQMA